MVVADTGPIHYLVLIEAVGVLGLLYGRVLIPQTVAAELEVTGTPDVVRAWIAVPPEWLEIRPDPPVLCWRFSILASGAAIMLAISHSAERLVIDEPDGRAEAERRGLSVTGRLGVLADAHRAGLLDFELMLIRLRQTNFYLSASLIDRVRRRLST